MLAARITGYEGCFSYFETKKLIKELDEFCPDVVHLHTLHNSYINLRLLFSYIKKKNILVVWTLHDCWPFTGHCTHFTVVQCDKWKTGCDKCTQIREYPSSIFDNSRKMWKHKKRWFTGVKNMIIVTHSKWLANLVKQSYLKEYSIRIINNGIDLSVFKPTENDFKIAKNIGKRKIILGVTSVWTDKKGLSDFVKLSQVLDDDYQIVLVGVSKTQISELPPNIIAIERTNSKKELAMIYSAADVFVNPTYEETFPTTNLEARACQLPIVTYRTGGSPESSGEYGVVVECGNIEQLKREIISVCKAKNIAVSDCEGLDNQTVYGRYLDIYKMSGAC